MTTLFSVTKPTLECAAARPTAGSIAQLKKVRSRTQRVMRHLKELMATSENKGYPSRPDLPMIDLVAGLFHAVLKDDHLSPLIRVWFARLQVPVMRQALLDPLAFEDHAHPARRLIGHIGSSALGLLGNVAPCGALEQEIKRLVLLIEGSPLANLQVFEKANQEFDQFLTLSQINTTQGAAIDCTVCQHDQKETLTVQYRIAIRETLINQPVQNEIREFLHQVWAESLAIHAIHKGLDHIETIELKRTAVELIQINTALLRRQDRQQAIGRVPQLVKKLRSGMALIGLSVVEQDKHIQKIGNNLTDAFLSECHSNAPDTPNTERRSAKRLQKSGHGSINPKIEVEGMSVIDEDADIAWHLWECALVEQQNQPTATRLEASPVNAKAKQESRAASLDYWQIYPGDYL